MSSGILDITFRPLSTCAQLSAIDTYSRPVFPNVSSAFTNIAATIYPHFPSRTACAPSGDLLARAQQPAKNRGRHLIKNSYREIARSSLDTTVAETGYANRQLSGLRERRLSVAAKITELRKLRRTWVPSRDSVLPRLVIRDTTLGLVGYCIIWIPYPSFDISWEKLVWIYI